MKQTIRHADKTILVSAATGKQGGALLKYLLGDGWRIRALTRNPRGRTAQELSKSGVEVVQGDMEDLKSLKRAMKLEAHVWPTLELMVTVESNAMRKSLDPERD